MYGYAVAVFSFTNGKVDSASSHGSEIMLTCADYIGENTACIADLDTKQRTLHT